VGWRGGRGVTFRATSSQITWRVISPAQGRDENTPGGIRLYTGYNGYNGYDRYDRYDRYDGYQGRNR
jgi:hypothetical protein